MSDSDDSADIVKRVRGTVEGVTEEDVSEKAQKEITEALDELEQHVESLRNQDEGGKQ
jgi:exonuclease VII small subunit